MKRRTPVSLKCSADFDLAIKMLIDLYANWHNTSTSSSGRLRFFYLLSFFCLHFLGIPLECKCKSVMRNKINLKRRCHHHRQRHHLNYCYCCYYYFYDLWNPQHHWQARCATVCVFVFIFLIYGPDDAFIDKTLCELLFMINEILTSFLPWSVEQSETASALKIYSKQIYYCGNFLLLLLLLFLIHLLFVEQ